MVDHASFFCCKVEETQIPIAIFKPFDPIFLPPVSLLGFEEIMEGGFGLFKPSSRRGRFLQRGIRPRLLVVA